MHETTRPAPSSAAPSPSDPPRGGEGGDDEDENENDEDGGEHEGDEEARLHRAVRSRDRDAVRSILTSRGARQRGRRECDPGGSAVADAGDGDDAGGVEPTAGGVDGRDRGPPVPFDGRIGGGSTPPVPAADSADDSSTTARRPSPFDAADFACPVCRRLLYKPCVNSCGHAFCFWCLHRAMNAHGDSACPTCRNPYRQFARPLGPLHRFLARAFPEETGRRRAETEREEGELFGGTGSPDVALEAPPLPGGAPGDAGARHDDEYRASFVVAGGCVDAVDLLCVSCRCVVADPVVPSCGHLTCRGCITVRRSEDAPVSATSASTPTDDDSGDRATYECPQCGIPVLDGVGGRSSELGRCAALMPLLAEIDRSGGGGGDVRGRLREAAMASTTTASATMDEGGGGIAASASSSASPAPPPPPPLPPPPPGSRDDHVHHGVGCDGCGTYPIVGRAYRCSDCPQSVGYDVCHACAVRGVHLVPGGGRFDQSSHGPDHRMEEREQVRTIIHALADARPDLTPGMLMQLLEMHMEYEAEADAEAEAGDDVVAGEEGGGDGSGSNSSDGSMG